MKIPDPTQIGCGGWSPPRQAAEDKAEERLARTTCSAFVALMASIERIRDRAKQYAEEEESEECYEAAEKQRKVEGTLNEILRIGKVLESNLTNQGPIPCARCGHLNSIADGHCYHCAESSSNPQNSPTKEP